jgi:hypothetical protein
MARIKISELIFVDSESYLTDLNDDDMLVFGGNDFEQILKFAKQSLSFALAAFAIYSIVTLVQTFTKNNET